MGIRGVINRSPVLGRAVARTVSFNLVNTFAAGVGGIVIARELGPSGRGDYATIVSWLGAALIIGELGQSAAVVYFSARTPEGRPAVIASSTRIMLQSGAVAILAAIVAAFAQGPGTSAFWSFLILAAILPISFVAAPYVFVLQATELATWNWIRAIQPWAWLSALLFVALYVEMTVTLALGLMFGSILLQALVAWRVCEARGLTHGTVDPTLRRPLLGYGLRNMASALPTGLMRQLDVIVLGAMVASTQVGHYSVAMSFALLSTPIASAIGSVLFPTQARTGDRSIALIRRYLLWTLVVTILATGPVVALSPWLLPLMYGDAYRPAVDLVFLLLPALVALSLNQVAGSLLRGQGHPGKVAVAAWVGFVVLLGLLVVFVPFLGVVGACIAASSSQVIALGVMVSFLGRECLGSGVGPR